MNRRAILGVLALFMSISPLIAQNTWPIALNRQIITTADSVLFVNLIFNLDQIHLSSNRTVVCTPLLVRGDSVSALPRFVVNGRNRHILYNRLRNKPSESGNPVLELRRKNGESQELPYTAQVPLRKWMERAELRLVADECGCGWGALKKNSIPLLKLTLSEPIVLNPQMIYVVPKAETVKARSLEGSAFLDFPVNRTEIFSDYRNNLSELRRIHQTIEQVRKNPFATIKSFSIKGYASPEGTYKNNAYLAKHRAMALLHHVESLYDFGNAIRQVDFEPEDWDGLEKAVENGNLPDREQILEIIRADEPQDPDAREWRIKNLNGGASYRILLRDVYPALRHSDYKVDYEIRSFTVEEAKELIEKEPSLLSLNEMFQVAQTYDVGTSQFCEVFETAVRLYPNDPISNLNAAISAVQQKQMDKGRRYLQKAIDSPEKKLVEAALLMYENQIDEAEVLLRSIETDDEAVLTAVADNLKQIQQKKEEMEWSE